MEPYVPNLGHTPDAPARRDAVHVPVVPLTAGNPLCPGDFFLMTDGLAYWTDPTDERAVGYVDPVLRRYGVTHVPEGARFWGCILPGTITGLQHTWQHPAFNVTTLPARTP